MANLPVFFFRDGWRKKKSSYKTLSREKQRNWRRCHVDGLKQAVS